MERFRQDNTEGFEAAELTAMNAEFEAQLATEGIAPDDPDQADHLATVAEDILRRVIFEGTFAEWAARPDVTEPPEGVEDDEEVREYRNGSVSVLRRGEWIELSLSWKWAK